MQKDGGKMKKRMRHEMQCIWVAAFRYSLGRSTYMPDLFCDEFQKVMETIDTVFLEQFVDDIEHAVKHGLAGEDCDVKNWLAFKMKIENEIERRKDDGEDK